MAIDTKPVRLSLREAQLAELDILLAFDAFCKKHGLRMYLCGGTLLGAVRHGGFIPWDDDVDVFMPRPDYERMLKIGEGEAIGGDLELAHAGNGRFMRPFARVYFKKSQVVRKYSKPESGAHIWLDILPVDGLPEDEKKLTRLYALRKRIDQCNFNAMWKIGTGSRKLEVIKRAAYYPLSIAVGTKRWAALLEWMALRHPYGESATVGCFTGGRYGAGEAMPREKFEIPEPILFEGHEFATMSCYREYLSGIYGDYMTPPPENRRSMHMLDVFMEKGAYDRMCAKYPELNRGDH